MENLICPWKLWWEAKGIGYTSQKIKTKHYINIKYLSKGQRYEIHLARCIIVDLANAYLSYSLSNYERRRKNSTIDKVNRQNWCNILVSKPKNSECQNYENNSEENTLSFFLTMLLNVLMLGKHSFFLLDNAAQSSC